MRPENTIADHNRWCILSKVGQSKELNKTLDGVESGKPATLRHVVRGNLCSPPEVNWQLIYNCYLRGLEFMFPYICDGRSHVAFLKMTQRGFAA